ncbi:MAG: dihydropteroate synthase [Candidatus Magnetoovum sp. WYHC-5]|nr:dihydropteroate synthase [Candidatus Magnetoovum sp. WYHC-5]
MNIVVNNQLFDFSKKTYIMGILNITEDSFSDGGKFLHKNAAIEHALQMEEEGADIIDIGGESTRPGASMIDSKEELRRVLPIIEELAAKVKTISIDTYKPEVAKEAIEAGASIVNDVYGLRYNSNKMTEVIAKYDVPVVIMHMRGTPETMQKKISYINLLSEISAFFNESFKLAASNGIDENKIIIDPGIGFGKTFAHNLQLIKNLQKFKILNKPILVGPSRKTFIGEILGNVPTGKRLMGTASAVTACVLNGANIVRVHDVKEIAQVVKIADAIKHADILEV